MPDNKGNTMRIKKSQLRRIIQEEKQRLSEITNVGSTEYSEEDSLMGITDPEVSSMLLDALDKFGGASAVLVEMGIDYESNSPENLHSMFQKHLNDNARMAAPRQLTSWLLVRGMNGAYEDLEALLRGSY